MYKTIILLACLLGCSADMKYGLYGGDEDNHGIFVVTDEDGNRGLVCDDEFGHNEVMAVCRSLEYTTGTTVSSSSYELNETPDLDFLATSVSCPDDASDIGDCGWTPYDDSELPCYRGEALAVSCSNSAFEATMDAKFKLNKKKSTAKVQLTPEIKKYGIEVNIKMFDSKVSIFSRTSATEYTSIATLKFKKNKGYFQGKIKDVETVVCAVAVVRIDDQPKVVKIIGCDDETVTEASISTELTALWNPDDKQTNDT